MVKNMRRFDQVYDYLMSAGAVSGCHQRPDRSFFIKNYQFPLCARCTGLVVGYIIAIIILVFYQINFVVCMAMCAIMYLDWKIQDLKIRESTNYRRFVTGIICGIGYIHFISLVMNFLKSVIESKVCFWV